MKSVHLDRGRPVVVHHPRGPSLGRWFMVAVAMVLLAANTGSARAGGAPDPLARPAELRAAKHLERGDRHFRQAEYDKALMAYLSSLAIERSPRGVFNAAQTYRRLGRCSKATEMFLAWIREGQPPPEMRAQIEVVIKNMKARCPGPSPQREAGT